MTITQTAVPAQAHEPSNRIPDDAYVLPEHITEATGHRGPRFGEDIWDFDPFLPRTDCHRRMVFSKFTDPVTALTLKELGYSRLRRGFPSEAGRRTCRPMKLTCFYHSTQRAAQVIKTLQELGAPRLRDARREDLTAALARWKRISPSTAAHLVTTINHIFQHSPFLSADRLNTNPWAGRPAAQIAGLKRDREENSTLRIPEYISSPLVKAAAFYVDTASQDIFAAQRELADLNAAEQNRPLLPRGQGPQRIDQFIAKLKTAGRPVPAVPLNMRHTCPGAAVIDGVVQVPNVRLISLLAGVGPDTARDSRDRLAAAGRDLGFGQGGLRTPISTWPDSERPWCPGLGPTELMEEVDHLRTACWVIIAFLSGMRDAEVRELSRDCAVTETTDHGRRRYKLRGRVFKWRKLSGDEAEWVVLEIVHRAVEILREISSDPTHLFGYWSGETHGYVLTSMVKGRINNFRDHVNELFSTADGLFIPNEHVTGEPGETEGDDELEATDEDDEEGAPWSFDTRQFRRTLAWHIAHQPFGILAGTRQYHHAKTAMFEGYAGTSASGFAAEVAAEEAVAKLDYVEDLYRDWNDGNGATGGAAKRVHAEFDRIRRELGDLPGVVAGASRLRTMLRHLVKTVHPGVLNDCFYQASTAVCSKRAQSLGRPLPLHNMCLSCPNSRRSSVHLPRLTLARDQALSATVADREQLPPLQLIALNEYSQQLDDLITEITDTAQEPQHT
ncbi:hypothetical protein [Streptomyces sp. NPDC048295]|uniref:hypothetical protein n=1 Tax=Streptomyces sp. NPDC048295 TaxID=3154617 RepID=UPI003441F814